MGEGLCCSNSRWAANRGQGSTLVFALLPRAGRICKLWVKGKLKLHLACPTGQVRCIYFRFTFENVCKFCGLAIKPVLENMLSYGSTMFYLILKYTILVKVGVGQVKVESHLPYRASSCIS